MIRPRIIAATMLMILAPSLLASCGKKGPLEHPDTSSPSTTAAPEADDKDEKQDQGNTAP